MLSKIAVKRPVSTIMVLLMIVVLGVASIIRLPQALIPDIELPVAMAMVTYPGAGPEEMENLVTEPMESQLASIEGLDTMMSMTMEGASIVVLQFDMSTDMNFATLDMREKMSLAQMMFPEEAGSPTIMKMSMDVLPVMQVYASADMEAAQLNDMIEENVVPQLERLGGVASVDVTGGVSDEVSITFQQETLAGYGLTLETLQSILAAENISLPSGNVTKGSSEIIVRTIGEFESVEEISQLPVMTADRSIIHLGDLATVVQKQQEQTSISRIDGKPAIGIFISKSSDGNIVDVSDSVQRAIADLSETFPQLQLTVGYDQADYIRMSIASVVESAIMGALLAVIVIFLFLRNIRSTLVIAISIPSSVLFTFALMHAMGMSLNLFTLCSLTLAVGMLVDNSVVVLENIFRTGKLGMNAHNAAIAGSTEVFLPVLASTLTSVVVYLPIALSGGMTGMMFRDFSLTIVAALMASLIMALTVVPMLCSKLLDGSVSEDYIAIGGGRFYRYRLVPYFTKFITYITNQYEKAITYGLEHRKRIIAGCLAIFVMSVALIGVVGMELLPATDEGSLTVTIETPYGTTLEEKDALAKEVEDYVMTIPELDHVTASIGGTTATSTDNSSSSISVMLVPLSERERSTAQIVKEIKHQFADVVGADITVEETSTVGMMLGGTDIQLDIMGNDLDSVEQAANELAVLIADVEGVVSAQPDVEEGNSEVVVRLDRNIAAHYGVTAYQLANGLSQALSGVTATELKVDGEEIDVNLKLSDEYGESVENMKQIMINSSTGVQVPVGQIAEFEFGNSPSVINRLNQQNVISVGVDVEGRDLGSVSQEINEIVADYQFPDGTYYESGGMDQEMVESFSSLALALVISILLVYLVLAAQFESIILPVMIMVAIPFAMSGAFLALFLTGVRLSMTAFIGLIMLVGIVVNNSILLVEFIKQNKESMSRNVAIVQAGILRLRPILMTTLTTVIGMIPLAMGSGEGMELLAPMGISIIGGLTASTLVTLLIIPVLYAYVDDMEEKNKQKRRKRKQIRALQEAQWLKKEAEKNAVPKTH